MDEIFESVGAFGLYQKLMFLILGVPTIISSITIYSTIFTLADPKLICINKLNKLPISSINKCPSSSILNNSYSDYKCSSHTPTNCMIWKNISNSESNSSEYECFFDRTYYHETMITDFNLICERSFYASLLQTFYLVGTFSTLIVGYFSDRYGRKRIMLIGLVLLSSTLFLTQLVNFNVFNLTLRTRYIINAIAQFIIGGTSCAIYVVGFILFTELTTFKYGNIVSTIYLYIYVAGELINLGISYLFKNWNYINLFTTIFSIFTLVIAFLFLPESPKFLLVRNRLEEAYDVINKIKTTNEGKMSKSLDKNEIITSFQALNTKSKILNTSLHSRRETWQNFLKILFLIYIWFALNMSFYGVSLGKNFVRNILDLNFYFY